MKHINEFEIMAVKVTVKLRHSVVVFYILIVRFDCCNKSVDSFILAKTVVFSTLVLNYDIAMTVFQVALTKISVSIIIMEYISIVCLLTTEKSVKATERQQSPVVLCSGRSKDGGWT